MCMHSHTAFRHDKPTPDNTYPNVRERVARKRCESNAPAAAANTNHHTTHVVGVVVVGDVDGGVAGDAPLVRCCCGALVCCSMVFCWCAVFFIWMIWHVAAAAMLKSCMPCSTVLMPSPGGDGSACFEGIWVWLCCTTHAAPQKNILGWQCVLLVMTPTRVWLQVDDVLSVVLIYILIRFCEDVHDTRHE